MRDEHPGLESEGEGDGEGEGEGEGEQSRGCLISQSTVDKGDWQVDDQQDTSESLIISFVQIYIVRANRTATVYVTHPLCQDFHCLSQLY